MVQEAVHSARLIIDGQQPITIQLNSSPYQIGRDRSNSLVLSDNRVSREHAELLIRDGTPIVRDRGSSNGTMVNDSRLTRGGEQPLASGDVIGIGPYRLAFIAGPARPPASLPAGTVSPGASVQGSGDIEPADVPGGSRLLRRVIAASLGLLGILFVCTIAAVAVIWLLAPPSVSLLILGSDARPSELAAGDRGRTDTLVAYIADRDAGRNLMISVPRDLWVSTSATSAAKINTVYRAGGADGARRAVSSALGLPIDRHLVIGLQGVRDVVDSLGGIDVDVETAIRDERYPTDDFGVTTFEISAGPQHLDGETALRFARTRHGDDDLARIARQQRVLTGIRNAASNPLNLWRLPGVVVAVQRSTETNVGPRELATLASAFLRSPGAPERFAPSWNMFQSFTTPQGEAALRFQPSFYNALSRFLVDPGTTIEVLNASGRDGTATRAANALNARGVPVARVGTAERNQLESVIQVNAHSRLAGQAVTSALGLGTAAVQVSGDLPSDLDVRVVLGTGYTSG